MLLALLVLGLRSGLGRAGVVEIEGDISVHIRPETTAQIHGGPAGGPYEAGPFTGKEVLEIEFIACLCGENPITALLLLSGTLPTMASVSGRRQPALGPFLIPTMKARCPGSWPCA